MHVAFPAPESEGAELRLPELGVGNAAVPMASVPAPQNNPHEELNRRLFDETVTLVRLTAALVVIALVTLLFVMLGK